MRNARLDTARSSLIAAALISVAAPAAAAAQHIHPGADSASAAHDMWSTVLDGWHLTGMAQAHPIVTIGAPGLDGSSLSRTRTGGEYALVAEPIGATRWLITTAGYGFEATTYPLSVRPLIELQRHDVWPERGDVQPDALFGAGSFWSITIGARVFIGGEPMRMAAYGPLDPMIE